MDDVKRISIFTGHFGSGKTALAVNYAIKLRKTFPNVTIVDMDIVNPYFRANDARCYMESNHVNVIAPRFAGTNLDIPALPAEIYSVFGNKDCHVVLDVGGDGNGALALGRYNKYIIKEDYQMFFVINTKRPLTQTATDLWEMIMEIESASRLKITGAIDNTNLSSLSSADNLINSGVSEILQQLSNFSPPIDIPLKYVSAKQQVVSQLPEHLKKIAFSLEQL